ncbi:hypothetical protein BDFB_008996, partial [Asbolus verrucosus]
NTPGHGIEYEVHIPAYFALKLNTNKDVEDFTMRSNQHNFGNLDDVLIDIRLKNGRKHHFAFQLKHKEAKNNKKLLPTNFAEKGDFNLAKYCESKREVTDFKMVNLPYRDHFFNVSFFDESSGLNGVYKFVDNSADFKRFFPRFSLFVRQKDSRNVEDNIINIFVNEYKADAHTAANYINFFRKWHKGEFTNNKLDKRVLNVLLVDLLLSPFVINCNAKVELVDANIRLFDVTVVEGTKDNLIRKFGTNVTLDGDDSQLLQLGKEYKIVDRFATALTTNKKQKIFNYVLSNPFFVEFYLISENLISRAVQLSQIIKMKPVLVGPNINPARFSHLKVFQNLEDLQQVDEDFFRKIANEFKISIQGRRAVSLQQLEEVAKLVGVEQLLQENFAVGEVSEELPKTYITRTVSAVYLNTEKVLDHSARTNDVLIINCNGKFGLIKHLVLRKGLNTAEIHQFDDGHYQEVILLENDCSKSQFDEICTKTRRNVHLVQLINEQSLLLVISSNNTLDSEELKIEGPPVEESDIYSYFNHPINFVCAQPGMGKSTLFKYLKNECPSRFWTVAVDLKEHNSFFKQKLRGVQILNHFLGESDRDRFTGEVKRVFAERKMLSFFFDGLDEVDCTSVDNVLDCVQELASMAIKLEQYEIPALQSCLGTDIDELCLPLPKDDGFLDTIKQRGDELGVITKFDDANRPVFDHETYAEFFACKWLYKNLKMAKMLQNCLFSEKYQNLKLILDILLAEDSPLHLAVIYKDLGQFERHLRGNVERDKGGRTPLHLACSYGTRYPPLKADKSWYRFDNDDIDPQKEEIQRKILTDLMKFDPYNEDALFKWTALEYALASQCLLAIEVIMQYRHRSTELYIDEAEKFLLCGQLDDMYKDRSHLTVAYYSSKFGFSNMLRIIADSRIFRNIFDDTHSLLIHLAVSGNHRVIVELLLEAQMKMG